MGVEACVGGRDGAVDIRVKAVPGAKRQRVAGVLGDRVKLAVAAPPEGGRANDALCRLLASVLGVSAGQVSVVRGAGSPTKTLRVEGLAVPVVERRLSRAIASTGG